MADLITPRELAVWTQTPLETVEDDEFAAEVMSKVSDFVRFVADQAAWTYETAPFDVKMIVLWMCKRTYSNPDQEVSSNVGPIGSRVLDVAALGMALSESERETLEDYRPNGAPGSGLWVQPTTRGEESVFEAPILYVGDDQQVNLATSPDPREWMIPMFSPGDPGGEG